MTAAAPGTRLRRQRLLHRLHTPRIHGEDVLAKMPVLLKAEHPHLAQWIALKPHLEEEDA